MASRSSGVSPPLQAHLYFIQLRYKYSIFHPLLFPSRLYSTWSRCVVTWMRPPPQPLSLFLPPKLSPVWFIATSFWSSQTVDLTPGKISRYIHVSPGYILHSYYKRNIEWGGCWRKLKKKKKKLFSFAFLCSWLTSAYFPASF